MYLKLLAAITHTKGVGKKINVQENANYEQMYASENYLYGMSGTRIKVFAAEDISRKLVRKEGMKIHIFTQCLENAGEEDNKVVYSYLDMKTEWLVFKTYADSEEFIDREWEYEENYEFNTGTLISKKTGESVMESWDTIVYFDSEKLIEVNEWGGGFAYIKEVTPENCVECKIDIGKTTLYGGRMIRTNGEKICFISSAFGGIPIPYSSYSFRPNGMMYQQKEERVCCYNLEEDKLIFDEKLPIRHKAIYADEKKYIVYHDQSLEIYDTSTKEISQVIEIKEIKKDESYSVELCGDRIFFYQGNRMVTFVEIN